MCAEHVIMGRYRRGTWEIIDTYEPEPGESEAAAEAEVERLAGEYRMAYGSEWQIETGTSH